MTPLSTARATAWTRVLASSLRMALRTCVRTVSGDTPRSCAKPIALRP